MDSKFIVHSEDYFLKQTLQHYHMGLQAFNNGEYLSAVVWGAVFIEALLKDILSELEIAHDGDDLNQLITKTKNAYKHVSLPSDERILYHDISGRCNEIRLKRNRIVHDIGTHRGNISADATDMYENHLGHILEQYTKTGAAKQLSEKNRQSKSNLLTVPQQPLFPVFISTITPHTLDQEVFIEAFCKRLEEIGVAPKRCVFTEYDYKDPIGKVRKDIQQCNAVIVLGLERCHAYYYKEKEGSKKESEGIHRFFSSGWLQLESGIAAGLGKEIFVLCQKEIHSDGIFDRGWNSYLPVEIDGPLDINHPKIELMLEKIKEFMNNYHE